MLTNYSVLCDGAHVAAYKWKSPADNRVLGTLSSHISIISVPAYFEQPDPTEQDCNGRMNRFTLDFLCDKN